MNDILSTIVVHKLQEISRGKKQKSLQMLEEEAKNASPVRSFVNALQKKPVAIIAELKKASPSKGLIRKNFDPEILAIACQAGGAACLSVLTDSRFFQGSNDNLKQARAACSLPVLQKDFFYDVWQIAQARAIGADCILLIMSILSDAHAQELSAAAQQWGMDVLVETHNAQEVVRAISLNTKLIGINNRDLKNFTTDISITEHLAPLIPSDRLIVCESGISQREDILRIKKSKVKAFLIGESLMRQDNIQQGLEILL